MPDPLTLLCERCRTWAQDAHRDGWLDAADVDRLAAVEFRGPADLFISTEARPLVVAFFGGTGVGKSSLLNRIAGEPIARVGVERPTSHEVTLYAHASVDLATLPGQLRDASQDPRDTDPSGSSSPARRTRLLRHTSDAYRNVLWVDAPDIDSVEAVNRETALAWLPFVDLVCYVVSPERYRDDRGWRVLLKHGRRHAWLFVMNRWDEGDAAQAADFAQMLAGAGFDDPVVLRTSCRPGAPLPTPDQFGELTATIDALLRARGVEAISELATAARARDLAAVLDVLARRVGDEPTWTALRAKQADAWSDTSAAIRDGLEWVMRTEAARFARRGQDRLVSVARALAAGGRSPAEAAESPPPDLASLRDAMWDSWCADQVRSHCDTVDISVRRAGLAAAPVGESLLAAADRTGSVVRAAVEEEVRWALARPGRALQRVLRRATGFLMAFLPLATLLWVAAEVVRGYYRASVGSQPFLGFEFVAHSAVLLLIAWAVPFALDRVLRPRIERVVLGALRRSLAIGLARAGDALAAAVRDVEDAARRRHDEFLVLIREVARFSEPRTTPSVVHLVPKPTIVAERELSAGDLVRDP